MWSLTFDKGGKVFFFIFIFETIKKKTSNEFIHKKIKKPLKFSFQISVEAIINLTTKIFKSYASQLYFL